MKQQVNFYTDEFKPKRDLLSLSNMLVVWIAGIVITLVLYSFESEKTELAKKGWQTAQQREQHQKRQFTSLQQSFASRGDAVVLEKTKQDLQTKLQLRNFVLEQLGLRIEGMSKGVAGLMESLSYIIFDDLWLTDIQINGGQLSVSGMTSDAERVPQLIQQLQSMNTLQDKRFSRLEVKSHEAYDSILRFTLQSENQVSHKGQGQ